jgi:Zn ribbon nucleic-acid-binding protein
MRIQEMTNQSRFDFHAIMVCEHCGNTNKLTTGYDDSFYHNNVIPAMTCVKCGLNRAGENPKVKNDYGTGPVTVTS